MVIEIENYEGDTLLYGAKISFEEFKKQIKMIEKIYDKHQDFSHFVGPSLCYKKEDNFVALLCRMYDWIVINDELQPQYVYDRDIKKSRVIH